MYGHEFKLLRQTQGITQKRASSGICSESKLSRWENDQVEVEFSTAIKLLTRIHVTSHEFLGWSKFTPEPYVKDEIWKALESKDILKIRSVAKKQFELYHKTKNKFDLFVLASLCNALYILERKNYLPSLEQKKLVAAFSTVNIWSEYYLSLFGNSVFLLPSKNVYGLSTNIIQHISHVQETNTTFDFQVAMGVLGDAILSMLLKQNTHHAHLLLKKLQAIEIPHYMMFFQLTFTYLEKLLTWTQTKEDQEILSLINTLVDLNCSLQASIYLDIFEKVKHAWDRKKA